MGRTVDKRSIQQILKAKNFKTVKRKVENKITKSQLRAKMRKLTAKSYNFLNQAQKENQQNRQKTQSQLSKEGKTMAEISNKQNQI